jgi:P-type Cu2+ transporter
LIALGIAGLSMMQVMMFTVPLYFSAADEVDAEARLLMNWAGFALTLPVLLFSARAFFVGAWRDLMAGRVSMDLPIALAIVATFLSSSAALFSGGGQVYFDSIAMFAFLLLAARYLEGSIRESSLSLIERLTNAVPAVAWRVSNYPRSSDVSRVAVADVDIGDVIRVASGEVVAADGVIVEGESAFDESLLSGESQPIRRGLHAKVVAGSLNVASPIMLRVTHIGPATTAAQLARLTEQALAHRPTRQQIVERIARWIAPLTIGLALAAAGGWWLIDPARSFSIALAVLAVTCPCALALAAPAAQALALTRVAKEGLLITRAQTLEKIAAASDIAFDKTGTLTEGVSSVTAVHAFGNYTQDEILAISVALEAGSSHPIARALATCAAGKAITVKTVRESRLRVAEGVEGEVDGIEMRLGKMEFVCGLVGYQPPNGAPHCSLFLGRRGEWLGAFALADAVKADAIATLRALEAALLTPHLLSGDRADRVERAAATLGFAPARVRGGLSAREKLAYTKAHPARWIAVGDGINDAPLMAGVDVSIAIGSGTDLTRLTADAVLLSPHLSPLVTARRVAVKMQRIIAQNFFWAVTYNLIAVPLAVLGFISPAAAALGMATSSLVVVTNSLRLLRG